MSSHNAEFRSIASLMLQRIIALSLLCLVGVGGIQVWFERQQQEKQFLSAMAWMVETSSRAMGHALWDIDREVLLNHIERLAEIEEIGFVRIKTLATGEVIDRKSVV